MTQKTKRSIQWVATPTKENYAGIHLFGEFWDGKVIENSKEVENLLVEAAKISNSTILKTVVHKFKPQGVTGFVLLAESHISIHTWPEWNLVAIDIFTCGNKAMPQKAFDYIKEAFQPNYFTIKRLKRGMKKK
ncbi:MAG: adenosylmethionine decarboxylase [Candidatus Nealsonbacteria bacterium]